MEPVALVTLLALLEYFIFGALVGRARNKTGVQAPAMTGHPLFERYNRVHQNTLEQLVVFVPALWLFSRYWSPLVAAGLGLVFVIGRAIYLKGYIADPAKRVTGVIIGAIAQVILLLGGTVGAVRAWLT